MTVGRKTGGRKKGTPNKLTAALRETILLAAEAAHDDGTLGYLTDQAKQNPVAFMSLLGKILPMQVAGDPENPLVTRIVIEAATHDDGTDQTSA